MSTGLLEHVNITVSDPERSAKLLCDLFGWHLRWQGPSMLGGRTIARSQSIKHRCKFCAARLAGS